MAPSGLPSTTVVATPATIGTKRHRAATTFTRGTFCAGKLRLPRIKSVPLAISLSLSFMDAPAEVCDRLRRGKAERRSVGQKAFTERAQALLCGNGAPPRRGARAQLAHERADAAACLQDARAFQLGVNLRHRVRVDAQVHGQLAHGRQLVADGESPR